MKTVPASRQDDPKLRFTKDGTFQISVFSDLHFAENATRDSMTKNVMSEVLANENPQLVVLNGDLISGEATDGSNSGQFLHEVVKPLVDANVSWASTYGNHDSNPNLDPLQDIYNKEMTYQNSLTRSMVSSLQAGITNYYLPVYPQKGSNETPALILWFFDSKGGHYAINRGVKNASGARGDWVNKEVTEWFKDQNANLTARYGRTIPSLAFYHIPAHAMLKYQKDHFNRRTTPGINGEVVVSQGSGDTDYSGQDSQFMRALLNTPGLMATFSGHDHDNDWCFKWNGSIVDQDLTGNGINMCYGRHTGYGGYGDAPRGGRQILLDQKSMKKEIETWIRLEDGTTSAAVTLNSTYGQDQYGETATRMIRASNGASVNQQAALLPLVILWMFTLLYFQFRRA
ncbi:putative inactive purple acid phosphatase 16 [Penicillium rolfsii]|nr:putative inactive purple acid phosphatase 16 [Penicillium rolfsii]